MGNGETSELPLTQKRWQLGLTLYPNAPILAPETFG